MVQRAIRTAAVHDPARRVYRFAMRAAPVTGLPSTRSWSRGRPGARRRHRPSVSGGGPVTSLRLVRPQKRSRASRPGTAPPVRRSPPDVVRPLRQPGRCV
ncbi:hypothetical protein HBB16_19545 [Pseudonocardia sp. MCCB 268]|nr:hypothetical protein [Pseudonocardia cytotoxica]